MTSAGRRFRLPRAASLKRRRWIRALFDRERADAETVAAGCIRILFRFVEDGVTRDAGRRIHIGFATGSGLRSAVKRNRIKRLLRESFRLNQHGLVDRLPQNRILTMMIVYRHHDMKSYRQINSDLCRALAAMTAKLDKAANNG